MPVVISGDGLIGAVGGAMAGSETPLGIIPGGRGNDLARVLGIPDDPEAAVEVLARRRDAADRRRRGQRQALPRHRQRRLRLRSQPARQRDAVPARQPRLRLRRAAHPVALEAGPLHGARRRRALPLHRLLGLGRQQQGLRRRHVHRARRGARRRRASTSSPSARSASCASWLTCPKVFKGTHVEEDEVRVFRARHLELTASQPFPVYADGEHLSRPARLAAGPAARAERHRAAAGPSLSARGRNGALFGAKRAAARAVGAASRASGRGGGTTLPGRVLLRLAPDAIARLGAGLERRRDDRQRHQRQDDDRRDARRGPRRRRAATRSTTAPART